MFDRRGVIILEVGVLSGLNERHRSEGFNIDSPYIYWLAQITQILLLIYLIFALYRKKEKFRTSTVIIFAFTYLVSWIQSPIIYSLINIVTFAQMYRNYKAEL